MNTDRFLHRVLALLAVPVVVAACSIPVDESVNLLDVDSDGDLDVFQLLETAPNTWTVFLNRAL